MFIHRLVRFRGRLGVEILRTGELGRGMPVNQRRLCLSGGEPGWAELTVSDKMLRRQTPKWWRLCLLGLKIDIPWCSVVTPESLHGWVMWENILFFMPRSSSVVSIITYCVKRLSPSARQSPEPAHGHFDGSVLRWIWNFKEYISVLVYIYITFLPFTYMIFCSVMCSEHRLVKDRIWALIYVIFTEHYLLNTFFTLFAWGNGLWAMDQPCHCPPWMQ